MAPGTSSRARCAPASSSGQGLPRTQMVRSPAPCPPPMSPAGLSPTMTDHASSSAWSSSRASWNSALSGLRTPISPEMTTEPK